MPMSGCLHSTILNSMRLTVYLDSLIHLFEPLLWTSVTICVRDAYRFDGSKTDGENFQEFDSTNSQTLGAHCF